VDEIDDPAVARRAEIEQADDTVNALRHELEELQEQSRRQAARRATEATRVRGIQQAKVGELASQRRRHWQEADCSMRAAQQEGLQAADQERHVKEQMRRAEDATRLAEAERLRLKSEAGQVRLEECGALQEYARAATERAILAAQSEELEKRCALRGERADEIENQLQVLVAACHRQSAQSHDADREATRVEREFQEEVWQLRRELMAERRGRERAVSAIEGGVGQLESEVGVRFSTEASKVDAERALCEHFHARIIAERASLEIETEARCIAVQTLNFDIEAQVAAAARRVEAIREKYSSESDQLGEVGSDSGPRIPPKTERLRSENQRLRHEIDEVQSVLECAREARSKHEQSAQEAAGEHWARETSGAQCREEREQALCRSRRLLRELELLNRQTEAAAEQVEETNAARLACIENEESRAARLVSGGCRAEEANSEWRKKSVGMIELREQRLSVLLNTDQQPSREVINGLRRRADSAKFKLCEELEQQAERHMGECAQHQQRFDTEFEKLAALRVDQKALQKEDSVHQQLFDKQIASVPHWAPRAADELRQSRRMADELCEVIKAKSAKLRLETESCGQARAFKEQVAEQVQTLREELGDREAAIIECHVERCHQELLCMDRAPPSPLRSSERGSVMALTLSNKCQNLYGILDDSTCVLLRENPLLPVPTTTGDSWIDYRRATEDAAASPRSQQELETSTKIVALGSFPDDDGATKSFASPSGRPSDSSVAPLVIRYSSTDAATVAVRSSLYERSSLFGLEATPRRDADGASSTAPVPMESSESVVPTSGISRSVGLGTESRASTTLAAELLRTGLDAGIAVLGGAAEADDAPEKRLSTTLAADALRNCLYAPSSRGMCGSDDVDSQHGGDVDVDATTIGPEREALTVLATKLIRNGLSVENEAFEQDVVEEHHGETTVIVPESRESTTKASTLVRSGLYARSDRCDVDGIGNQIGVAQSETFLSSDVESPASPHRNARLSVDPWDDDVTHGSVRLSLDPLNDDITHRDVFWSSDKSSDNVLRRDVRFSSDPLNVDVAQRPVMLVDASLRCSDSDVTSQQEQLHVSHMASPDVVDSIENSDGGATLLLQDTDPEATVVAPLASVLEAHDASGWQAFMHEARRKRASASGPQPRLAQQFSSRERDNCLGSSCLSPTATVAIPQGEDRKVASPPATRAVMPAVSPPATKAALPAASLKKSPLVAPKSVASPTGLPPWPGPPKSKAAGAKAGVALPGAPQPPGRLA